MHTFRTFGKFRKACFIEANDNVQGLLNKSGTLQTRVPGVIVYEYACLVQHCCIIRCHLNQYTLKDIWTCITSRKLVIRFTDANVTRCYSTNILVDIMSNVNKISLIVVDFRLWCSFNAWPNCLIKSLLLNSNKQFLFWIKENCYQYHQICFYLTTLLFVSWSLSLYRELIYVVYLFRKRVNEPEHIPCRQSNLTICLN